MSMTDPTPNPLEYAGPERAAHPARGWMVVVPALMLAAPVCAMMVLCVVALIVPTSPYERVPAVGFLLVGMAALFLESVFVLRIAGAGIPLILGCMLLAIAIIGNVVAEHLDRKEQMVAGGTLVWVAIVMAGHLRWLLILRAMKRRPDSN
jgi:hypothetical protein